MGTEPDGQTDQGEGSSKSREQGGTTEGQLVQGPGHARQGGGAVVRVCVCGAASDKKTVVTSVTIHHTGTVLPIQQNISCRDTHCLYILSCTKTRCMRQYAGLSSLILYIRFAEHLADVQRD